MEWNSNIQSTEDIAGEIMQWNERVSDTRVAVVVVDGGGAYNG